MNVQGFEASPRSPVHAESSDRVVDIGRDFSTTPGGRYKRYGAFSGEEFRETLLAPRLAAAIRGGYRLKVRIDSVKRSYQSSFLDEAFGGLIREARFSPADVHKHLVIVSDAPRFEKYRVLAQQYLADAME